MIHDELRDALRLRVFLRHPSFAVGVICSLAIGISVAAGIFAIVESAHYGPLPFTNADRIEQLYLTKRSKPDERAWEIPPAIARALQEQDGSIAALGAYRVTMYR